MPLTAVRDEEALRMWVHRLPVHIGPAEQTVYTELYGKFVLPNGTMWASSPTDKSAAEHRCNQAPQKNRNRHSQQVTVSTRLCP